MTLEEGLCCGCGVTGGGTVLLEWVCYDCVVTVFDW